MRGEKSSHFFTVTYIIICILLSNSILAASLIDNNYNNASQSSYDPYLAVFDNVNDWPMFRHDITNQGVSNCDAPECNTVRWQCNIGNIQSTPAISDGRMFVAAYLDGTHSSLYCIDIFTNKTIWETEIDNQQIISSPTVSNDLVYIGSDDTYVYCFYAENGTMKWRFKTGGRVRSSPAVYDGSVFIGSDDAYLYKLDALTGEKIWQYGTDDKILSSPAISNNKVFISSMDGYLYAIDIESPVAVWEKFQIQNSNQATPPTISSSPLVINQKIIIGSLDNKLYCVDRDSGQICWDTKNIIGNRVEGSPCVYKGRVYVGSVDKKLYCFDLISGNLKWYFYTESGIIKSSPSIADEKLFFITSKGMLYCINLTTKDELWHYDTDQTGFSSPIVSNGKVFVGGYLSGTTGFMYCIGEENKAPIANFSMEPSQTDTMNKVYFNDSSYDEDGYIGRWDWDFGDGFTSTEKNPIHIYNNNGVYIVELMVMDNEYLTSSTEKQIIILNRPPVVNNDTIMIYVNSSVSIDVLDNDYDEDGSINQSSLAILDSPQHGIAIINTSTHEIQYEPPIDYLGNDTFSYVIEDDDKDASTGYVFINITKKTHPVAEDDSRNTHEDTLLEVAAPGILSNDHDPDNQPEPLIVIPRKYTTHGTLQIHDNGSFIYKPDKDYTGVDYFTYEAYDGMYYSNTATVYITVTAVNDAPIAVDDTFTVEENEELEMNIFQNDIDVDGNLDKTSISIIDNVSHGIIDQDHSTGLIIYKPNQDYVGKDHFTYTINDTKNAVSNIAWVNITITGFIEPKSKFSMSPANPIVNQTVRFKDKSTDQDGSIVQWKWYFGDDSQSSQRHPTHIYEMPGNYTIKLTVKDNDGLQNSSSKTIRVYNYTDATNYPEVFIHQPADNSVVNGVVLIKGNATSSNNDISKVQIRINQGIWETLDGTTSWSYNWDTTNIEDGTYLIEVRCFDMVLYSNITKITVEVQNHNNESDTESPIVEISFPTEGYIAQGNITIRGIARDNVGIEFVEIRFQNQDWQKAIGTTSWTFELDSSLYENGLLSIDMRSYDGHQYSDIERVTINIQNQNANQQSFTNNEETGTNDDTSSSSLFFFVMVISVVFAGLGIIGYVIKLQV